MRGAFLVVALAVLVVGCGLGSPERLTRSEFRDAFIAELEKANPDISATVSGDLSVKVKQGDAEILVSLNTGYEEYLGEPTEADSIIQKWAALAAPSELSKTESPKPDALVYVLRNEAYVTSTPDVDRTSIVFQRFGGDLVRVLAFDSPAALSMANKSTLDNLKLTQDEAWSLADRNIKTRMGQVMVGNLNGNGPFAFNAESGLATAILGHPDECGPTATKPEDGRVVLVLDRNSWISTLPDDPLSVQRFWNFAKPLLGKGQLISDTPLTCKNGKWEVAPIPS